MHRPELESVLIDALELALSDLLSCLIVSTDRSLIKAQIQETLEESHRESQASISSEDHV